MIFDHFIVNKKFYILTMHKMCENVCINNFKKFLLYFLVFDFFLARTPRLWFTLNSLIRIATKFLRADYFLESGLLVCLTVAHLRECDIRPECRKMQGQKSKFWTFMLIFKISF